MNVKSKITIGVGGALLLFGIFFPIHSEPDWANMPSYQRGGIESKEEIAKADSLIQKAMEHEPDLFTLLIKVVPITLGVIISLLGLVWKFYSKAQDEKYKMMDERSALNTSRINGLGESFDSFVKEDFGGFKDSVFDKYLLKSDFKERHDEIKLQMDRIEGKVDRLLGKGI